MSACLLIQPAAFWRKAATSINSCSFQALEMNHSEVGSVEGLEPEEITPAPPPDGGYGWVVVGSCFTLNALTWGVTAVSVLVAQQYYVSGSD